MLNELPKHYHAIVDLFKQYGVNFVLHAVLSNEIVFYSTTNEPITFEDVNNVYGHLLKLYEKAEKEKRNEKKEAVEEEGFEIVSFSEFMLEDKES